MSSSEFDIVSSPTATWGSIVQFGHVNKTKRPQTAKIAVEKSRPCLQHKGGIPFKSSIFLSSDVCTRKYRPFACDRVFPPWIRWKGLNWCRVKTDRRLHQKPNDRLICSDIFSAASVNLPSLNNSSVATTKHKTTTAVKMPLSNEYLFVAQTSPRNGRRYY